MLAILKTCFAEEASAASLFKISILSSRSDILALRLCVAIFAGLVLGVLVGELDGGSRAQAMQVVG